MIRSVPHDRLGVTPEQARALKVYSLLMGEVRVRTDAMLRFAGADEAFPTPTGGEAAFLQLRLVCELIALGCLVAHGDLKEVKSARLQKAYEADFIIKSLERLHGDFFPVPHTTEVRSNVIEGVNSYHFAPHSGGALTKEDLIKLYRRTGAVLHRGSLKALFSTDRNEVSLIEEAVEAHGKIVALLSTHHVMTRDREFVIVCAIPESGDVQAAFAGRIPFNECDCSDLVVV
ncbi:hypothetical protein D3C72_1600640 [compost metagenome]